MKVPICKLCGREGHYKYQCWWLTPNNIKRFGKGYGQWKMARMRWFADHPADHYDCYICGKYLTPGETTLDHVIPRSNAKNYAKRHDHDNLRPCCYICNAKKGSKHGVNS